MLTRNGFISPGDMLGGVAGRWNDTHAALSRLRANPQEFSTVAVSEACDIHDFDMGIHVEVAGVQAGNPRVVHSAVVYRNRTRDRTGERQLDRWFRRCHRDPAVWAREDPAWAYLLSQSPNAIRTVTVRGALHENWQGAVESNKRRHMPEFADLWGGWFHYFLCDRVAVLALYAYDRPRDEGALPGLRYGMSGWAYHQNEGDFGPATGHPHLTPSEHTIAAEMVSMLSNKQIASKLGKKTSTINTMISRIARKYDAEGRIEYIAKVAFPWQRLA